MNHFRLKDVEAKAKFDYEVPSKFPGLDKIFTKLD